MVAASLQQQPDGCVGQLPLPPRAPGASDAARHRTETPQPPERASPLPHESPDEEPAASSEVPVDNDCRGVDDAAIKVQSLVRGRAARCAAADADAAALVDEERACPALQLARPPANPKAMGSVFD